MKTLLRQTTRLVRDESGTTAVVYALLVMLAILAGLSILTVIGQNMAGQPPVVERVVEPGRP